MEEALAKAGAEPGDTVLIGDLDDAVVFDWAPELPAGGGHAPGPARLRQAPGRTMSEPGGDFAEITVGQLAGPARPDIAAAHRAVVKIGSSSLTTRDGSIDDARIAALTDALAARVRDGRQVLLVSSGAIAAGLAPLGLQEAPEDLATQQAAASVGQGLLIARYTEAFKAHGLGVGQVLLTADDLMRRAHYRNAQRTLDRLLELGIDPGHQRERHGGHRGDPVRRQRPPRRPCRPRRAGRAPSSCSPTSTASTTATRARAARAGSSS